VGEARASSPSPLAGEGRASSLAALAGEARASSPSPLAGEGRGEGAAHRPGDLLTPDERARLARNFTGYDISPDMVRLSLVNLYLHGFSDPHIVEYDTLTSDERWHEHADVILANPPFMSPKGGIKPHKRFSIQAKRSEVLFVDYMAEHLTPNGRAGIIVPEGIIFQSQGAYTQLRKLLVEHYLVAVVSLPAGVFQPYSGVKTSILILDKSLAKQSDTIAFFKVDNDGYGLGAQRRAIDKNDLPQVKAELAAYLHRLRAGEPIEPSPIGRGQGEGAPLAHGLIVPKSKIAANGDYNLSGERYREGAEQSTHFPWRTVESLVETITPPTKIQKTAFGVAGRFPIIDQSQDAIAGWTDDESTLIRPSKPLVIFGDHTCAIKLVETPFAQGADGIKILQTIDTLDPRFLFRVLRARPLESDGYQRHYSKLKEHQIPLPPLEVQKEIVAEIEGYQKVINGARAVLDHYRPHIPIHPDWPMVPLEEACEIQRGKFSYRPRNEPRFYGGKITFTQTLNEDGLSVSKLFQPPIVVITIAANIGDTAVLDFPSCFPDSVVGLIPKHGTDARYLEVVMRTKKQHLNDIAPQAAQKNINIEILRTVKIPLPPLATQQAIVAEIEAEQALVAANRELIARFEQKIQATLARVWGEAAPAGLENVVP
jgi:type I restriction enzyme M protein